MICFDRRRILNDLTDFTQLITDLSYVNSIFRVSLPNERAVYLDNILVIFVLKPRHQLPSETTFLDIVVVKPSWRMDSSFGSVVHIVVRRLNRQQF